MSTIITPITPNEYHRDPCPAPSLSSSVAKVLVSQSPLHAWSCHPRLGGTPRVTTSSMAFGTLIHAILLAEEGMPSPVDVIEADDFRTKAAQSARDESIAKGKTPIARPKFDEAAEVAGELIERFRALGLWPLVGKKEHVLQWQSEGVWCRAMLDVLELDPKNRAVITDLKSTANASPKAIARSMIDYGYDIQQHAYIEGVTANYPALAGRVEFRFVFFELEPPYAVTPAVVAGSMAELGASRWNRAKQTWRECLRSGRWPGYAVSEPMRIEAPAWALVDEMEHSNGAIENV